MRAIKNAISNFFASIFSYTSNWPTAGVSFNNGESFNDLTKKA